MLVTFGVVAAFVGMEITPEQSLTRFPDIRAARTVENSFYLGVLLRGSSTASPCTADCAAPARRPRSSGPP